MLSDTPWPSPHYLSIFRGRCTSGVKDYDSPVARSVESLTLTPAVFFFSFTTCFATFNKNWKVQCKTLNLKNLW